MKRRTFLIGGGAVLLAGAGAVVYTRRKISGGPRQRPPGVPLGPFGADSSAEEVTAGLDLKGKTALVTGGGWELALWAVIGLSFGAARAASGALMAGAAVASVVKENGSRALVAFSFACTLTSPIGVLLWGTLIGVVGVEWTLLVGATGVLAVSSYVLRRAATSRVDVSQ